MVNHITAIVSLLFLSVYILFSYELVSYQKNVNEALIETNKIVSALQECIDMHDIFENDTYFNNIELKSFDKVTYIQYSLTTIKHYRCDISFFNFSEKDIITTIYFCSNH